METNSIQGTGGRKAGEGRGGEGKEGVERCKRAVTETVTVA